MATVLCRVGDAFVAMDKIRVVVHHHHFLRHRTSTVVHPCNRGTPYTDQGVLDSRTRDTRMVVVVGDDADDAMVVVDDDEAESVHNIEIPAFLPWDNMPMMVVVVVGEEAVHHYQEVHHIHLVRIRTDDYCVTMVHDDRVNRRHDPVGVARVVTTDTSMHRPSRGRPMASSSCSSFSLFLPCLIAFVPTVTTVFVFNTLP